jgi:hypothetical protein
MSIKRVSLFVSAFGLVACMSAHADRAHPRRHGGPALVGPESPYEVELIGEAGQVLPTFAHGGRHYVLGDVGGRYTIRVTNPTPRRVEAVVSVDGLDVVDGRPADFVSKRGYIVPAGGELRIDGFRTSTSDVATFRFSSVSASYAGRKGIARNVGVIGVALFEEKEPPQIVLQPVPLPEPVEPQHHWRGDARGGDKSAASSADESSGAPAGVGGGGRSRSGPAPATAPAASRSVSSATSAGSGGKAKSEECCGDAPAPQRRPGLGTEFGERRTSHVQFTSFERRNARRPTALAELRYNDADGLRALGIALPPPPSHDEIFLRETADPFPRSGGFASPPPH